MNPSFEAVITSWDWRIEIIAVLLTFGTLYTRGWLKLRQKKAKIATRWRLISYYAGLIFIAIALMSFFDVYQYYLFFIHMSQHLLLMMVAPPLLWLASPMPVIIWAFPREFRFWLGQFFQQKAKLRGYLRAVSSPVVVWFIYTANLWGWHDPNAYDAAILNDLIHDIEHITFFLSAMLLWWHITNGAPKIHGKRNMILRLFLVAASYFQNLALGVGITMWGKLIFAHYATVPRYWGIDPETDQMIGGLLMWLPNGMMYGVIILFMIWQIISKAEKDARIADKRRQMRLTPASETP